ncbi:MAG: SDR family NAD(P)-dependent oxidoreductase, partial [Microvirga sp.]
MTISFDLSGKTAIVTGANTGLGQGISLALAQAGASIVAVGRSSMDETERLCRDVGARFHSVQADLSSLEPIERIVAESTKGEGRIDILVNNAGIIRRSDAIDFSEQDWDDVMNVNLKSTFFLSQAVARRMLADDLGGKIINVASQAGRRGEALVLTYCASKCAVISMTQSIALA